MGRLKYITVKFMILFPRFFGFRKTNQPFQARWALPAQLVELTGHQMPPGRWLNHVEPGGVRWGVPGLGNVYKKRTGKIHHF